MPYYVVFALVSHINALTFSPAAPVPCRADTTHTVLKSSCPVGVFVGSAHSSPAAYRYHNIGGDQHLSHHCLLPSPGALSAMVPLFHGSCVGGRSRNVPEIRKPLHSQTRILPLRHCMCPALPRYGGGVTPTQLIIAQSGEMVASVDLRD